MEGDVPAAWNLYFDALANGVPLTMGEGAAVWYHDMARRIGFDSERTRNILHIAEELGDDPDEWGPPSLRILAMHVAGL